MNQTTLKGDWKQIKGRIKQKWGKLTDDDLTIIEGEGDELVGILQTRYGLAREEAQKQCDEFYRACGCY